MSTHEYGDRFSEAPLFAHEGIKPSFAAKHRMQGEIGDALAALLWASLRALGLSAAGGSIAELEERILAGPLYRKWLRESLLELERRDYLRISGERYQAARVDADDLQGAWAEWERRKEDWCAHADLQAQVALVEQTMRALPAILGARRAATDVIFPDSSLALVEGVYRHNELARHYNDVLADIVERYIHESLAWNPSARLRILEIGAGTGGTSAVVLEKIASYRAHVEEYCYTDISRAFLLHAEERFGADHPFLSYRLFNVEEPLAPQGIEVGSFDIVIAANVLHATRNIANTVRNAKALLAGNGLLVLNEVSRNTLFAHLTFGLLEGWWLYEDAFVRIPGSPALSSQAWQAVLEMEGFRSVFFPAESLHDLGQQIVVAESDGMVRQKAPTQAPAASVPASPRAPMVQDSAAAPLQPQATLAAAVAYFRSLVAETLKMSSADIDPAEPLERYGLDSILIVKMTGKLKDSLGPVSSTLLFEHQSVNAIARHFLATKQDALTRLLGLAAPPPEPVRVPEAIAMPAPAPAPAAPATRDIAIVGLSGRYPQADTVEQFWARLRDGITCTGEIPAERWDWRQYHAEERGSKDGSYSRWGGFLSDVDKFDPLFFRITPAEAEAMDPQARLFLEQAHACIEDAGYTPASLSVDGRVGVFAGVMNAHYPGAAAYWSVANRVSYLFDFTGPSMAVDTACSSALTAIHLAIESIHSGACDCAIAGGVNLILDPQHYLDLTAMNMLSSSAQCRAFGAGADGFVDAEGVGAVLLKPLAQARQDGDQIYGVIKASMLNAGGRTNGYTVPNPAAQARLVAEALTRADVPARAVSYVEAHGTGTALGDPIEVEGLARAFGRTTNATQFCALGSVKSNIGHCESAAGIAGLTKVLLQMKHRQLVPTLHAELSNTEIDFSATPFYLQRELAPWTRPRVRVDGKVVEYPRIASISSFGAGGANALLVVQEEVREDGHADAGAVEKGAVLVPLSAKDDERLRAYAARLADALGRGALADRRLADIAYTLQVGREAMPARLALVVSSCEELAGKLARFARHEGEAEALAGCHRGTVGHRVERADVLAAHGADEAQLRRWTETGDHARLAALWVDGVAVDWTALKRSGRPRRISLPTYPFARERYWKAAPAVAPAAPASDSVSARTRLFEPVWEPSPVETGQGGHDFTARHLILCDLAQAPADLLTRALAPTSVVRIDAGTGGPDQRFASVAEQAFDAVRAVLRARTQGPVLIQIAFASEGADALFAGLDGLLRTAELENTRVVGQLIDVGAGQDGAAIVEQLRREGAQASVRRIRYRDGVREAAGWRALPFMGAHAPAPWRPDGVYLVSGGLGGLGLLLAADIAPHLTTGAVVLVGRSAPSARARARLDRFGSRVACLQADVASQSEVNTLVETIVQRYGKLTGVIHAAGVTRDSVMLNKTLDEWRAVYAAKVHGVACLDEATAGLALDFFALFSSAAAVLGNIGQADYASANGFLDAYAEYRTGLARSGRRHGKTVAIDWPLWQDGGMQLSADVAQAMRDTLGVTALPTRHGMQALYQALSGASTQLLVIEGDPDKLAQRLARAPAPAAAPAGVQPVAAEPLRRRVSAALKAMYAEIIKLDAARIDASAPLENYGIDSLQIAQMNKRLDALFGEVSKTLFYEYQTLDALAAYLAEAYGAECRAWLGVEAPIPVSIPVPPPAAAPVPVAPTAMPTAVPTAEPIAIIGMSGRYPNAADLGEYWNNLAEGKDCISEIPAERWSLDGFFEPDRQRAIAQGKSYSKWGGFLDGYADFDAAFFNISPREALSIDPHERLFLQSCWEVLEDAGYTRERIAARHRGNVGVFAGITKTGFDLHGYELLKRGDTIHPHTSFSSVANRVSYVFNLHGPSVPVDTMCSSSLTAIHEACAHIQRGDCEMAIAGGVNLYLHPTGYVGLSAKHMLSDDGRCKSFGAHANGFVPGEGVGAVLLKPLSRALADGDRIHAVIRATSINHGGKTNGYTVPNPNAQAQLIRAALVRAGVNARTVSYVEAHGTGTELGDPIEVAGLTQAFRHDTADAQFCALGSVKSNIGHLEAAAGIAGLTKIVLQMKHQALSPSLHADELNPNIAFARTPFFVQRERGEWKRPVVAIDGAPAVEFPRIACLSSFGAGGANAHVVLEEYVADEVDQGPGASAMPALIVLSARTGAQLREQARRLLEAAQGGHHERFDDADLHAVAQTLQTGREAMQERLALACTTVRELCDKLAAYCDGARQVDGLFTGQVRHDGPLAKLAGDDDAGALVDAWLRKGRFNDLLELWVAGFHIDWERLHGGRRGKPVSLPTYPFLKERHWFDKVAAPAPDLAAMPARVLHPLVHENTSDLSEQRYSSTFTGAEFFLRDHVIQGTPVLPGVAALEMALHAVGRASGAGATALSLCNVAWVQPIQVSTPRTVHIGVYPAEGGQVDVEIYSESEDGVIVHSQGAAMPCAAPQNVRLDVDALRGACAEALMPAAECYAAYRAMGIDYGPSHQAIEQVHVGPKQVLARLALPAGLAATAAQFVLHPALLDGALQALIGMVRNAGASGLTTALVPFALDRLDVLDPVLDPAFAPQWVWARYSADDQPDGAVRKFDIDLCDGAGQVGVRLAGFSTRALVQAPPPVADAGKDLLLLTPGWRAADSADASAPHRHVVVLCDLEPGVGAQVTALMDGAECVALERPAGGIAARFGAHALGVFDQVRGLLASRSAGPVLLQVLAPAVGEQAMLAGLAGLLKTARAEDPNLLAQLVEVERCDDAQALVAALRHGRQDPHAARVRSTAGGFASGCWEELTLPADAPPTPWKDGGVYLITGGAGAIGLLLADEIARRARNPVLVLVGRSAPGTALQGRIAALRATGAKVEYRQADVADPQAVEALLGELARLHGPLNGILHCAGVTRDAFIAAKPREHWRAVLAPKVDGIVNLDHGSRAMPLDLFVAFSSAAGALGNPGQADYAAANAFMDAYCGYRASLARAGQRHGASLSINWPLWADGGMALDAAMVEHKLRPAGLALLRTDSALHALYHALAMGNSQVMVLEGDGGAIRSMLRQHAR